MTKKPGWNHTHTQKKEKMKQSTVNAYIDFKAFHTHWNNHKYYKISMKGESVQSVVLSMLSAPMFKWMKLAPSPTCNCGFEDQTAQWTYSAEMLASADSKT